MYDFTIKWLLQFFNLQVIEQWQKQKSVEEIPTETNQAGPEATNTSSEERTKGKNQDDPFKKTTKKEGTQANEKRAKST